MSTRLVLEATRVQEESNKGREIMLPFKKIRERYGKKSAEALRERKKLAEQQRDPRVDPKPYVLDHPDGIDDPEPWTLLRLDRYVRFRRSITSNTCCRLHVII